MMIRDKMSTRTRLDFSWQPDSSTIPSAHLKRRFGTTGATASITSGELRIVSGTVADFTGGIRYAFRGGQISDNFEIYARMKWVTSGSWFPSILFRASPDVNGLSPNRTYQANFSVAGYNFSRKITGVEVSAGGGNGAAYSSNIATGGVFHLRIRVQGDQLLMRGWKAGETEPNAWPVRVVDTAIPRKGEIGILVGGGSVTNATLGIQEFIVRQIEPLNTDAPTDRNLGLNYSAAATLPSSVGGHVIRANATTAPFTLTLPSAASVANKTITVKKIYTDATTNAVTLAAAGTDLIDGAATYDLSTVKGVVRLLSYSTGYDVI